jgi:RHS repeat-associated protein
MADQQTTVGSDKKNSDSDKTPFVAPQISQPKGGGAIRGIGEKFAANPVTGTGSLTVPIFTSPGRSGFGPQLSLSYDSGAGNGPFGFGWSLALPSITRKTDKGLPQYADDEESDTFILSGAEDLVASLVPTRRQGTVQWEREMLPSRMLYGKRYQVHRYRPRVEGLFACIERWVNLSDTQDSFWRSISKDNITTWYGRTMESRIADPTHPSHIFTWLICERYDDKGNVTAYEYKSENSDGIDHSLVHERNRTDITRSANRYIKRVFYGNGTPYFPDLTASAPLPLPTDWCFELVFDYGEHDDDAPVPQETGRLWNCRGDPFSTYRATFEVRTYRLCRRALMFHHFQSEPGIGVNYLVRSTDLIHTQYTQPPPDPSGPFYSHLLAVTQIGYRRNSDGSYLSKALPPLEFEYTEALIDETVRQVDPESLENLPYGLDGIDYRWVDLDGEGLSGILTEQADSWFYKPNLSPVNLRTENGRQTTVAQFGPSKVVAQRPSLAALASGRQQLLDLSGDGQLDLVQYDDPTPGFFERTDDEDWRPFMPFQSLPVLNWRNPNLKFIDLTGDGFPDLLISEDNAFWWYKSLAAAGFGARQQITKPLDEEKGPKLVFADSTESIFLADVSGDGLTDLVRIRNGEVCYWPNLGYGLFGVKITMDQSPWFESPDLFDGRRIRLADIDGSGTTDIIYFASGGVHLYFNQSGNGWGQRRALSQFPPVESASSATVLDLLGNGTACIVWSSPLPDTTRRPMRYADLMDGHKPHLLVRAINNLGAETRIQYVSSTKFYVADKLDGTPWITRVPFPVHVVERMETYDYVSRNRFVTRYAYHHGYYDGVEREFRGFGRVDQWDTEEFAALSESGAFPPATNVDTASQVAPVLTKTWFHTGAYFGEARISKQFEHEYYHETDATNTVGGLSEAQLKAMLLRDTVLPSTCRLPDGTRVQYVLSGEEAREACRSLKGSILRQEIYSLDLADSAARPYTVSERNYTIERLQPQGPNRFAVFFTHARETVDFRYERRVFKVSGDTLADSNASPPHTKDATDPRVTHAITLDVDVYGNVLESAAIAYGRRYKDPALTSDDHAKQSKTFVTYTENRVTNAVLEEDALRAPVPCEMRTDELINVKPDAAHAEVTNLFRFEEMRSKVRSLSDGLHDIPYESFNGTDLLSGQQYRRPIQQVRTLYRPNDLGAASGNHRALLPLGRLQSLAIAGSSYKLAFTPGLLSRVYQHGQEALLADLPSVLGGTGASEGGYVDLDGDGRWWMQSGRVFHHPDPHAVPVEELDQARQHFFLPRRFEDPFGQSTTVEYGAPHDLLIVVKTDAVGNTIKATNDYRVLQPILVTDSNNNRVASIFDALGMVVGTAVMGKATENLGDSLEGFIADLTEQQTIDFYSSDSPHAMAGALLGNATTRVVYDVNRFRRARNANPVDPTRWQAVFAGTIVRETHVSDLGPGQSAKVQISFSYSDGFNREIQKKIQAEPGRVPSRDASGKIVIGTDGQPEMTRNDVSPRWVGSGWTIFNNKGKPVRQYEPFFTDTHRFEFDVRVGISPVLSYDPVGRVVATLHPNHTWEKVVFDPWRQETWDVSDTILVADPKKDPDVGDFFRRLPNSDYLPSWYAQREAGAMGRQEQTAARKAAVYAETPTVAHADSLERTFLTVTHNKFKYSNAPPGNPAIEEFGPTRVVFDIEGNQREVIDAKNRAVMRYGYDMCGNRIYRTSMEAGERWTLNDVSGKPLYGWDSRNHQFRTAYDPLRRPTDYFLREGARPELLVSRTEYGETQPSPEVNNLRAKVIRFLDQAGVVTSDEYDFKGNLLRSDRQLALEYKTTLDWSATVPLEADSYCSRTRYDALNRPMELTAPDKSKVCLAYNEANLLERVEANLRGAQQNGQPIWTPLVTNIDYDAKGQRVAIDYGNDVRTTYTYDPLTFRLVQLLTRRNAVAFPDDCPEPPPVGWPGRQVQNLHYTYDPVGNVTHIRDDAQQTLYFRNKRIEPSADYTYDAIYRLIEATGREHLGQAGTPPSPDSYNDEPRMGILLSASDGNAMGRYLKRYVYDEVGNFKKMSHRGGDPVHPGWTRFYANKEPSLLEPSKQSNRLTSTTIGANTETYRYDGSAGLHGNITAMPHLPIMRWDYHDQLQATAQQLTRNGGTPETTWYVYDASGKRVRKVIERQAPSGHTPKRSKECIYIGGLEIYREYDGDGTIVAFARETLAVTDDKQRIALVETSVEGNDASFPQLIRYQFANHLGSTLLEINGDGKIISYEEYTPYGSTSYQAIRSHTDPPKRYRFSGKERDRESGLYYFGARYYAPWLGEWISCDPTGIADGVNPYEFVRSNPVLHRDLDGRQGGNSNDDIFTFIRNQAAFQAGAANPPIIDLATARANASPFGTAAHAQATQVVNSIQQIGVQGAEQIYSEVAVNRTTGVITQIGGSPIRGNFNLDLVAMPAGSPPLVANQSTLVAGQADVVGDIKYGGGSITQAHSNFGQRAVTVNATFNATPSVSGAPPSQTVSTPSAASPATPPVTATPPGQTVSTSAAASPATPATGPTTNAIAEEGGGAGLTPLATPSIATGAGNAALTATRALVPGVAEAETAFTVGSVYAYSAAASSTGAAATAYTATGAALGTAAAYTPVVGGSLVTGAVVGNLAEAGATSLGATRVVATGAGGLAAAGSGAAVGALIGSVVPGVGTAVGAGVGALAGLGGYYLSKYL